jgi:hypothetical protein
VEEAALLAGPVCSLKARLEQLLVEWPEHPVLVQLSAICDRLTGMPSNLLWVCPYKPMTADVIPVGITKEQPKEGFPQAHSHRCYVITHI